MTARNRCARNCRARQAAVSLLGCVTFAGGLRCITLWSAVALVAVAPAVVLSADHPAAEAADPAAHAGGAGAAHAQEGPITAKKNDVDLALWSLVTFVVFLVVLKALAWQPMIAGLDKREALVHDNIAGAETARLKAEGLLQEHAARLDKVQDEIREMLAEARRDAEHTKNEIMATAQKEAELTRQRAVQEIERARDQALDDLFIHMGKSVSAATEQVVGRSLTGADHDRLIEEALSGFTKRSN